MKLQRLPLRVFKRLSKVSEFAAPNVPEVTKEVIVISSSEEISSDKDIHFSDSDEDISFLNSDDDDLESDNDNDSSIYEEAKVASKPKHASKPIFPDTDDDHDDLDSDTTSSKRKAS
nr:hypothetical protein [Tanacetum cinerariifolium]